MLGVLEAGSYMETVSQYRRQQWGDDVMFWLSSKIICILEVDQDKRRKLLKLNGQDIFVRYMSQPRSFKLKIPFIQDNECPLRFCKTDYCPPYYKRFQKHQNNGMIPDISRIEKTYDPSIDIYDN